MSQVERHRKPALILRIAASLLLGRVLPYQPRLGLLVRSLRLFQRSGLQGAVRKSGVLRLLSTRLAELESSSPDVPATTFRASGQKIPADGQRRARVALLSGCVMPLVNGPEMEAVTRVLARNGCDVDVPREQVCCGAINSHVGDLHTARALARQNVDAFLATGADAVVVASAGCGIRMKEYGDPASRRLGVR